MRSLRYLYNGEPQNFDDCRDRFRKGHPVKAVSLDLFVGNEEFFGESSITPLMGNLWWVFEDIEVKYKERFGGIVFPFDIGEERIRVENANERLEDYLMKFERLGLKVTGRDKKFQYPFNQDYNEPYNSAVISK